MRLDAVTVCVHESDSLALTLGNRAQFDRWLIVTVPGDPATIQFCRDHGLDCHLSSVLHPCGLDLLAGSNRARAMAEGLAALGNSGWAAMISSYVLLPRLFRAQFDAATLDTSVRYRLSGFRRCTNRRMFERLKVCEPWQSETERADDEQLLDLVDACASHQTRTETLPISALLLSDGAVQWGAGILSSERSPMEDRRGPALNDVLTERAGADRPRLLVAGYHPGLDPKTWAPLCAQIFVSDDFGLGRRTGNAAADAVRRQLCAMWRAQVAAFDAPIELDDTGDAIADGSLDILYIPGEASIPRLATGLPTWRRKLKQGALVCGDLYGYADWPEASLAIAQFFGAPNSVSPSSFWYRRIDRRTIPAPYGGARDPSVVLVHPPDGDPDRTLASLHALRRHWPGRIIVQDEQQDSIELAAACVSYGAELVQDSTAPAGECLKFAAGILAQHPVADLLHPLKVRISWTKLIFKTRWAVRRAIRALRGRKPIAALASFTNRAGQVWPVPTKRASTLRATPPNRSHALVRYGDTPYCWSPAARRLWSKMVGERGAKFASPIPVAADSTILVVIDAESSMEFACNWPSWTFGDGVPVVAGCVGVSRETLDWSGRPPEDIVELTSMAGPRAVLGALLQRVRTRRVILLPAGARGLPGATLFTASEWSLAPIVFHSTAEVLRVNGALPMPWRDEPLLVSAATDLMHRFCADTAGDRPDGNFKPWLQEAARRHGGTWEMCNVERWGWRVR